MQQSLDDPEFAQQIKQLAPHWFKPTHEDNKKILINLAYTGQERPNYKTQLGKVLTDYVDQSCDPKFAKEIKELAPHWFNE